MWASCILRSDAHRIEPDSFRRFLSDEINTRILRLDDNRIRVSVRAHQASESIDEHLHHAHHVIKAVVLALNVGSLGHFYWEEGPWAHPRLTITDELDGLNRRDFAIVAKPESPDFGEPRAFSDSDEYRTVLVFGVFARGSANVLENEYCRGLLLHRMQYCEIDFRREAYMCFYRVLEHFVTRRILGVPKLQNELRDIQSCIRKLGFGEMLINEMKELYQIRSSQTAHAQNIPRKITLDEVMKIKIYVDALLNKTLLAEGNAIMERKYGPRADG
jgi:hypothetical protein